MARKRALLGPACRNVKFTGLLSVSIRALRKRQVHKTLSAARTWLAAIGPDSFFTRSNSAAMLYLRAVCMRVGEEVPHGGGGDVLFPCSSERAAGEELT